MSIETSQSPGASAQISNFGDKLTVSVDLTSATWNTVATHEVFTVTGLVACRLFVLCTETVADAGAASSFAVTTEKGAGAGKPDITSFFKGDAIQATTMLLDWGITAMDETQRVCHEFVVNGSDIGYQIAGEAVTDGTLDFILYWTPISDGATVVAGTGGSLT